MTWTRLPDDYYDRPEIVDLSDAAFRLDVVATVWCNKHLTDGAITLKQVRRLPVDLDPQKAITELILAGQWTQTGPDMYQVDWSEQEPAARVQERRERNAESQRLFRERRDLHNQGDHSKCDARFCPALREGTRNALRKPSRNASVIDTRPDPSRPPQGKGTGRDAHASPSADATGERSLPAVRRLPKATKGAS